MKKIERYTDKDWEQLASLLSGEETEQYDELSGFSADDHYSTEKQWKELRKMSDTKEINVDKAWNKIYSRIKDNELIREPAALPDSYRIRTILKIAATVLIVIGLASTAIYLGNTGMFSKKMIVATNNDQRNVEVSLPDGSKVFLNRNSELSYRSNSGKTTRNVSLKGEAFFEIVRNESKPFIIDAGKANIKVLGTSFNVITNNSNNVVEVFVKTGSVMLSDSSGAQNLILESGFTNYAVTFPEGQSIAIGNSHMTVLSYQNELISDIDGDRQKLVAGEDRVISERRAMITTFGAIKLMDTNFQINLKYKGNRDNLAYFDMAIHTSQQVPDVLLRQLLPAEIHAQPM
jgi:ferric-dicitrate binding protein FerR (iron transport regulator)